MIPIVETKEKVNRVSDGSDDQAENQTFGLDVESSSEDAVFE